MAAVALTAAGTIATHSTARAEQPAAPNPIDLMQAPGIAALQQLSPAVQQAAADPQSAVSLLMAAASAFAGSSPSEASQRVVTSVTEFVQTPHRHTAEPPAAHGAAAGALPGVDAAPVASQAHTGLPNAGPHEHLPTGIDPAHAVGPAPEAAPAPAPGAVPDSNMTEAAPPAPASQAAPPAPAPAESPPEAPAPGQAEPLAAPAPGPGAMVADAPPTQDFLYPAIGNGCLADGGNSIATALSVAGPAHIPTPGPGPGQTAYVFTAVGTAGPAPVQKLPLNVTWVNLSTGKSGTAALTAHPEINPDGPTTLTAIVDTGSGSILSTIFGQVTTTDKQCNFMPTIGSTVVP